jgi:hypothetical protein
VAIILRGMTALYAALRKGDPLRPDLRQRAVAALNSLIARQRPDGRVGNSLFDENDATDYSLYAFTGAARDLDLDIVPAIHGVLAHEHAGGGYAAYLEYLARRDAAARDDIAGRLRAALG